jgi:hypothetical protein
LVFIVVFLLWKRLAVQAGAEPNVAFTISLAQPLFCSLTHSFTDSRPEEKRVDGFAI